VTALTVIRGGINRGRKKGAANQDVLYDLLNGYVTQENEVTVRPGTFRRAVLPAITRGLVAFDGFRHTFAAEVVAVPTGYKLHVLVHPDFEQGTSGGFPLHKIHFAAPYLGFLYVAAEFDVGATDSEPVHHYWLQLAGTWEADKIYKAGDIVEPTVPNGLAYRATRLGSPNPSWAPRVQRTVGDVIEPTVYNDYFYTVVDTAGANPASGLIEPTWPTEPGARITEDTDSGAAPPQAVTTPPENRPVSDVQDRYGVPGPNNGAQP
jgi:hypothetical protein